MVTLVVPLSVTVAVVLPVTLFNVAEIVVVPPPCPAAKPPAEIVATEVFDEFQVALDVTFAVVLLAYVAVAVNCCVDPLAKLGSEGVTAMEINMDATTVKDVLPVFPLSVAEIVALPGEAPVARPVALTVATVVFVLAHVADAVTLPVDPSL
jgi:hypothetical protein